MSTQKEVASTSRSEEEILPGSLHSDKSKQQLKDAVIYYEQLLDENNLITSETSDTISHESMLIGQQFYESTLELLADRQLLVEEELIHENELCEEVSFEEVEEGLSSDEYEPEEKRPRELEHVPLDYKVKVVNIAKAHPTWSLQTLQKKGCSRLKKKEYISRWEEDIKKGGTLFDKYAVIDSWTYDRFMEARQGYHQVTTRNLQEWALAAAGQFPDFAFKASDRWIAKFKKKHGIRQRKITKFVTQKEAVTVDDILTSADIFRTQTLRLLPNFQKDYVINTDQTGM